MLDKLITLLEKIRDRNKKPGLIYTPPVPVPYVHSLYLLTKEERHNIETLWSGDKWYKEAAKGLIAKTTLNDIEQKYNLLILTILQYEEADVKISKDTFYSEIITTTKIDKDKELIFIRTDVMINNQAIISSNNTYFPEQYNNGLHRSELIKGLLRYIRDNDLAGYGSIRLIRWDDLYVFL